MSKDSTVVSEHRPVRTNNTNALPSRSHQHLDDADLLTWRRQYANIGLREDNLMSNSADDLSQLVDSMSYAFPSAAPDYHDPDDDELHFDNGNNFDYEAAIRERLKRANEEFQHDATPAELKHQQRVSFDSVVKAVDIVQESEDENNKQSVAKPPVSPAVEKSSTSTISSPNDTSPHEYTVPLNDTQPKEGPTLVQQIKAIQFHGGSPAGDQRLLTNTRTTNGSLPREDKTSSTKPNSTHHTKHPKTSDMSAEPLSLPENSMVVARNGEFELQNADDYTAKHSAEKRQSKSNDDENNDKKTSGKNTKVTYAPTPPTEAKQKQDPSKPELSRHSNPSTARPKSTDGGSRVNTNSNHNKTKSTSSNRDKSTRNSRERPKSAGVSTSLETYTIRGPTSVDFDELDRKAAAKRRAELQKQRREKEEAEAKRKEQLAKAKESFEKWVRDKDAERKRLDEEKRIEKEEQEVRHTQCEKDLGELREKKYKDWVERKNRQVMMANEFKKLQADEDEMISRGSSSSIHKSNRRDDHRAFNRWLRHKYEQSREEKRQLRLETRRLQRQQRRSIKRFQLQQDLQLARSFGYT